MISLKVYMNNKSIFSLGAIFKCFLLLVLFLVLLIFFDFFPTALGTALNKNFNSIFWISSFLSNDYQDSKSIIFFLREFFNPILILLSFLSLVIICFLLKDINIYKWSIVLLLFFIIKALITSILFDYGSVDKFSLYLSCVDSAVAALLSWEMKFLIKK